MERLPAGAKGAGVEADSCCREKETGYMLETVAVACATTGAALINEFFFLGCGTRNLRIRVGRNTTATLHYDRPLVCGPCFLLDFWEANRLTNGPISN